jgi:hypothetical protein
MAGSRLSAQGKGAPMIDARDLSEHLDPTVAEGKERAVDKRKAAENRAFVDKLAKRPPPNPVERAAIEKARKRTKARTPRIVMHVEDRGKAGTVVYPAHSDEEGHQYRLADTFGTRSLQFVYSMLKGLGKATEDHSSGLDLSPGSPDQLAFNAALAVIGGVQPKDETEAILAAQMALSNIALLDLFARTRAAIAGHRYEGDGIRRLEVLGNLTNKFMRTYAMQLDALARKRRKGEQNIGVEHVHVHAGGQAIVGNVSHRGGRGLTKNDQQPCEGGHEKPTAHPISDSPSVRSADQEWEALPVASDEKGVAVDCTAAQAVAAALLASGMGNIVTASGPRPRLRSGRNSAHC